MSDLPEPVTPPQPAPAPVPTAPRRWRRFVLYAFAAVGALALALLALAYWQSRGAQGIDPRKVSMDELIDQAMGRHYGQYDAVRQGWVQVDAANGQTYLARVVHRAKMESVDEQGRPLLDAAYFLVSSEPLASDSPHPRRLGAFVYRPEAASKDAALIETADPAIDVFATEPVRPEDVRFESLSPDTYGWVIKLTRAVEAEASARFTTNLVLAPWGDGIRTVASFPARARFTPEIGCARAAAEWRMAQDADAREREARRAARALAAASAASDADLSDNEDDETEYDGGEPPGTEMCSDATWTYKTNASSDGWADLIVTGGGLVNGREIEKKTYKLVYDPKGGRYVVPDALDLF